MEPVNTPFLHALLTRWHERTGSPVLINTSLNGPGDPLTETMTTVLTNVANAPTPKEVFFPPKDYRYEVPKFEFGQ